MAAVIHDGKVRYAVVGDTGPAAIIGEGSYALARSLGIDPDPRTGGTASGVTYILFRNSQASPIESPAAAVAAGEALARKFAERSLRARRRSGTARWPSPLTVTVCAAGEAYCRHTHGAARRGTSIQLLYRSNRY